MRGARSYRLAAAAASMILAAAPVSFAQMPAQMNDYPTETRAEYIFGCMQVNGNSRLALERCSCSIDVIASILPFEQYVDAETTMSLRQRGGESVSYMQGPQFVAQVKALKLAQIEGELRCF
jgi:hypothetical protein